MLFGPDLIIFSSGFDAHDEDPLACCELLEDDFVWCTQIGTDSTCERDSHFRLSIMCVSPTYSSCGDTYECCISCSIFDLESQTIISHSFP